MNNVFHNYTKKIILVYSDDILVYSRNEDKYEQPFKYMFDEL